jgi:hypothetical protein
MENIICCDKGLHEELCAKEQVYYLLPSHFDIRCRSLVPWMTVSPFYLLLMRSPVGGNSVVPNSFGKIQFLHFLMMVLFHEVREVTINVARIPTPYYGMHHICRVWNTAKAAAQSHLPSSSMFHNPDQWPNSNLPLYQGVKNLLADFSNQAPNLGINSPPPPLFQASQTRWIHPN